MLSRFICGVFMMLIALCGVWAYSEHEDMAARYPTSFAHSAYSPQSKEYSLAPIEPEASKVLSTMALVEKGVDGKVYFWEGATAQLLQGRCTQMAHQKGVYCHFLAKSKNNKPFLAWYFTGSGFTLKAISEKELADRSPPSRTMPIPEA